MPFSILVHLPVALLWGFVPGLGLALGCVPRARWWVQATAAPGLSAGAIGAIGLLERRVHVTFEPLTVAPALLAALATGVWRRRRGGGAGGDPRGDPSRRLQIRLGACALLAGGLSVAAMFSAFHDQPLPVYDDAAIHSEVAVRILRGGDVLPVLPAPALHSGAIRVQAGIEATAALGAATDGGPVWQHLLDLSIIAVIAMGLGLVEMAWRISRSAWCAALAPLLAVGTAFPAFAAAYGESPLITDSTLVIPLVVAVWSWVQHGERGWLLLIGACGGAIWVIHGTEVFTAAVLCAPLLVWLGWRAWRVAALRVAVAGAVAGTITAALVVLAHHAALPISVDTNPSNAAAPVSPLSSYAAVDIVAIVYLTVLPPVLGAALLVGAVISARAVAGVRWLVVAHVLMLLVTVDSLSTHVLQWAWTRTYPWSVSDRLLAIQYFTVPVLCAFGAVAVAAVIAPRLRSPVQARRLTAGGLAVMTGMVILGLGRDRSLYASAAQNQGVVNQGDIRVMQQIDTLLPANAVVLQDGIADSGKWIPVLSHAQLDILKGTIDSNPDEWHLVAMSHACSDPAAAVAAMHGAQAVYVGSRFASDTTHRWSAACIAALPGVRLLASDADGASLFRVDR